MGARWIADLWLDPSCPYTRVTATWLREVTTVRPVELRWHVMSLSVLNEHRDDDPEDDPGQFLWVPVRIGAAVDRLYGQEAFGRFCVALWHHARAAGDNWEAALEGALDGAGVSPDLVAVGMTTEYDEAVRAAHEEGVGLLGGRTGTPVVALTGPDGRRRAVHGPVLSTVPRGVEAAQLWDGILQVTGVAGFHSLVGPAPGPVETV